jgi:hypothetical protein
MTKNAGLSGHHGQQDQAEHCGTHSISTTNLPLTNPTVWHMYGYIFHIARVVWAARGSFLVLRKVASGLFLATATRRLRESKL